MLWLVISLQYKQASTVLSLGSIRQQFSIRENVLLSLHSSQFLYQVSTLLQVEGEEPPDIQFVDGSYLLLVPKEKKRLLQDNYLMQKSIGAEVELLDSHALARRFPWMNMAGVCLGSLGNVLTMHLDIIYKRLGEGGKSRRGASWV